MNKVVKKYYTVDKLPEELRRAFDPSRPVTLIVEQEDNIQARQESKANFRRYYGAAKDRNTSIEAAVSRIRSQRDEWN